VPYPDVALSVSSAAGAKVGMTAQARWRAGLQALKPRKSLNKDLLHLFNSPNVSGTGIMTNIFHTIFSIPHL